MTLSFGFNFQVQKSGENIVVNNDSVFWKKQYVDACKLMNIVLISENKTK